jgi:hypothetical protein
VIVHKSGGTSICSAERFASVADIVLAHHSAALKAGAHSEGQCKPQAGVIAVSAMCGVTDQPIAGARAPADGRDTVYRKVKADLASRRLTAVETLLDDNRERLKVGGLIKDQLHELMFSQSLSEHNLNLVVCEKNQEHCLRIHHREFRNDRQTTPSVWASRRRWRLSPWSGCPTGTDGETASRRTRSRPWGSARRGHRRGPGSDRAERLFLHP